MNSIDDTNERLYIFCTFFAKLTPTIQNGQKGQCNINTTWSIQFKLKRIFAYGPHWHKSPLLFLLFTLFSAWRETNAKQKETISRGTRTDKLWFVKISIQYLSGLRHAFPKKKKLLKKAKGKITTNANSKIQKHYLFFKAFCI